MFHLWGSREEIRRAGGQENLKGGEMKQKKRRRKSQEVKRRFWRTARLRQESQKRRRWVTIFSVGNGDLCGHKTGLFPLIWGSSCTPASPPALHTLNDSDIYTDTKTSHFFAASYFHSKSCHLTLSPFPPLSSFSICFTIAGTRGVCRERLSTLLTSTASSLSVFPPLPICLALPRLPAFEESG